MRVKVEFSTIRKENYVDFCKKNPSIKLTLDEWKVILYSFSEAFRDHILNTGERARLPFGFGEMTVHKKKRQTVVVDPNGVEHVNLSVDWVKTRQRGKIIYNFNSHTQGYFFGWKWFKDTARLQHCDLWYFKPSRVTSRMIAHYLKTDTKNQFRYSEWK